MCAVYNGYDRMSVLRGKHIQKLQSKILFDNLLPGIFVRRKGGQGRLSSPCTLKFGICLLHFQQKKVVFLVSRGKN